MDTTTNGNALGSAGARARSSAVVVGNVLKSAGTRAGSMAVVVKDKTMEVASKPSAQVAAASATGSAVLVGSAGSAAGLLCGGAMGAVIGILPAIFTFGLSIPVGAVIGGGCGVAVGGVVGSSAGFTGGGVTGYLAYRKRAEIKALLGKVLAKFGSAANQAKRTTASLAASAKGKAVAGLGQAVALATVVKDKAVSAAGAAKCKTIEIASNKTVQVTAASAT